MRTANNTHCNFTVENLVAKYRNYVSKNCPKSSEFDGEEMFIMPMNDNAEGQLLITLYCAVAGEKADPNIKAALADYAKQYHRYAEALSQEEFSFLCEHFAEAVFVCLDNYRSFAYSLYTADISEKEYELIKDAICPEEGSTVFIAGSGDGEIATLYPNCHIKGFSSNDMYAEEEIWALGQLRMYAQGIVSDIQPFSTACIESSYLSDVDYVVWGTSVTSYDHAETIYHGVKPNSKMLFMLDKRNATVKSDQTSSFLNTLVKDKAIKAVISYELPNKYNKDILKEKILLLVEKSSHEKVRIVNVHTEHDFEIPSSSLDPELLWPGYYEAIRPNNGRPLSDLVSLHTFSKTPEIVKFYKDEYHFDWVLPEEMKKKPVARASIMAQEYKDANLVSHDHIMFAGDPILEDWKTCIRSVNAPCVLLYGDKKDYVIGYISQLPEVGFAAFDYLVCLMPKEGIDVRYVAALLLMPEVKKQIRSVYGNNIDNNMFHIAFDKIIVPAHDEKERLKFLTETNYEALISTQKDLKKETEHYKKSIRMRKHALTQSLSSIEAMFYALNAYRTRNGGSLTDHDVISRVTKKTVGEAFDFISQGIKDMMPALEHLADVEYSFAQPEWINPENFIEDYIARKESGWMNFKPITAWQKGHNLLKRDIYCEFLFPKDALERILNNIVANAQAHGFTNKERSDYQLRFAWRIEDLSVVIEVTNNGTPIPADRDTTSLLEYGVSSALHQNGHNGIGCNEIDDIMQRYKGSVKIISTPNEDFTVKYVLKFSDCVIDFDEPELEDFDESEPELEDFDESEPELEDFDEPEPELEDFDEPEPELEDFDD